MRIYTSRLIREGATIHGDDLNEENLRISEAINGQVDAHNLPTSITPSKLEERDYNIINDGGESLGVFSDIYNQFAQDTPLYSIDLRTTSSKGDWNELTGVDEATFTNTFNPGVMEGTFVVDVERRTGYNGATKEGEDFWTRWGLFFDGALLVESDRVFPRRVSIAIPFVFYQPGGEHTFEIKWLSKTGTIDVSNSAFDQELNVYMVCFNIINWKR